MWKTNKQSDQQFFKYDHTTRRIVNINCNCPTIEKPNLGLYFRLIDPVPGDPGSGNLTAETISYPTAELRVSIINIYSFDVSAELASIASISTTITISNTNDPSIYATFTKNSATNNTSYWTYNVTVTGGSGSLIAGDYIVVSAV